MKSKPFIVACIPAYNEERTIGSVLVRAMRFVDRVVVCDDGSGDLTGAIAGRLGAVVVRHERNMGCGAVVCSLFREARRPVADVVNRFDGNSGGLGVGGPFQGLGRMLYYSHD